jgi:hypothetical protein
MDLGLGQTAGGAPSPNQFRQAFIEHLNTLSLASFGPKDAGLQRPFFNLNPKRVGGRICRGQLRSNENIGGHIGDNARLVPS